MISSSRPTFINFFNCLKLRLQVLCYCRAVVWTGYLVIHIYRLVQARIHGGGGGGGGDGPRPPPGFFFFNKNKYKKWIMHTSPPFLPPHPPLSEILVGSIFTFSGSYTKKMMLTTPPPPLPSPPPPTEQDICRHVFHIFEDKYEKKKLWSLIGVEVGGIFLCRSASNFFPFELWLFIRQRNIFENSDNNLESVQWIVFFF